MKKLLVVLGFILIGTIAPVNYVYAQNPIVEIIKAAVIKAIKAADLKIQRLQNKTIWLQNAQKALENTLTELKLDNITGWVEKQKDLYEDYYEELYKVKAIIAYYDRIRDISEKQKRMVEEYQRAWTLFSQDGHFTAEEMDYMAAVYTGLLDQSSKNMDQILLVVNSFTTQMSDAKRLEIINATADQVDANYYDLIRFNQEATLLSVQRFKSQKDIAAVKRLHGLK
jgi:hypothetical protein